MPVERCGRSLFTTTLSVIQDSIMDGLHRTRVPKKKKYVIVPAEGAECDGIPTACTTRERQTAIVGFRGERHRE